MTSTSSSMINGRKNNDNKNDDNKKKRDKKKKKKEKRRRGGSFLPQQPRPPLITITIMIVLCFVFVVIQNGGSFIQIKEKKYNLRWEKIFKKRQYYRLWTSALMHNDIQHFVLNLIGTYYSGRQLENKFGSKYFMLINITSSIITPLLYVSLAYLHDTYFIPMLPTSSSHNIMEGTIGFSGILFSWTTIQCNYKQSSNPNKYSNVFGLMKVPPIWYPWVLTIALAIIDYEESCWLHHISGILIGTLKYYYIEGCSKESSSIRSTANNINETDVAATGDDENSSTTINSNPDVKLDPQAMRKARLRKFD